VNEELLRDLQSAQQALEPQFKALRDATGALKGAIRLAADDKPDALPMQKALVKLQQATAGVDDARLQGAARSFQAETEKALDALSFEFAKDLKESFERRGMAVEGRPPTLVVGELVLHIDIAARKAQWFYGKEALTRPLPLSISTIMKAYEGQRKLILERDTEPAAFLGELYKTWEGELASRARKPLGNRLNLVETYSKLTLNRQSARFWNAPSRSTFRDYPRPLFVRDLVLVQPSPTLSADGKAYRLRLGTATKSQADQPSRSVWVPSGPLGGEYYADITFEEA
jgi:hypothetical protein